MRALLALSLLLPALASAQEDRPAGLFTKARQLPLVSQSLRVRATTHEATVELTQVFFNDGDDVGQADFRLHLPEGASVVSFGFWNGDSFFESTLKEKGEAETAHQKAASEGRTTALLESDGAVQSFSVYPLRAKEEKRIEVTLRLPVARELGRSHLRLPVDRFLGGGVTDSSVLFEVRTEGKLKGVEVLGGKSTELARGSSSATVAAVGQGAMEVRWHEEAAPLVVRADAVPLDDGGFAVQLGVALNHAGEWAAPYREVHVVVDGSFSMRRKAAALTSLLERLAAQSPVPVRVHAVGASSVDVSGDDPVAVSKAALSGRAGHAATWGDLVREMNRRECKASSVRCIVVTDASLEGAAAAGELDPRVQVVVLADAEELTFALTSPPSGAQVFQPEAESAGKLLAIADALVLPVLEVESALQGDRPVAASKAQSRRIAEGGLLRLLFETDSLAPISLKLRIADRLVEQSVAVRPLERASDEGKSVRRAFFEAALSGWMREWKATMEPSLKARIIEVSLREGIPTAFTAMQVDSPELSLVDIKPGDPLLSVDDEPGLEDVVAWYPFGETRRLVFDERSREYVDRFLVPRGWDERSYAVEVFKYFADGTTRAERVWYRLDETAPAFRVQRDAKAGVIRVSAKKGEDGIASVGVHRKDGRVFTLSGMDGVWSVPAAEFGEGDTLVIRDRAGNRSEFPERRKVEKRRTVYAPVDAVVSVFGAKARAPVMSTEITATLRLHDGRVLFGTQGGDLVIVEGDVGSAVGASISGHPVMGLAELPGGRVLVGVLGAGLYELSAGMLRKSRLDVGSVFITGVVDDGRDVLVGTAYNGLWRISGGRALKSRFPESRVLWMEGGEAGAELWSGERRYHVLGRDRFVDLGASAKPGVMQRSSYLTSAVEHDGTLYAGGFDRGLLRLEDGALKEQYLGLSAKEGQVNALSSFGGALFLGTEGGLLRVGPTVERMSGAAVHDLAPCGERMAVASGAGIHLVDRDGGVERIDFQKAGAGKFLSVACHEGAVYAGSLEGLYRFEGGRGEQLGVASGMTANWVTALAVHAGTLFVGTYDLGVFKVSDGKVAPVRGLETQWVPPRGLRSVGGELFVGGLGQPAVRVGKELRPIEVPVRDVNDVVMRDGELWLMTSDGLRKVPARAEAW